MKKGLMAFLMVAMMLVLAACGNDSSSKDQSTVDKAKEEKVLVMGTNAGYYPFEMFDKKGDMIGYDVDVARAIAKKMGATLEVQQLGFDALIPAVQAGKIDIAVAGITATKERKEAVDFTDSYYTTGQAIMVGKDSTVKSLEDLDQKGNTIAVQVGTTGAIIADKEVKNATIQQFEDFPTAALATQEGKVDGIIYDETPIKVYALQNEGKMTVLDDLLSEEDLSIAVKKGDKDTVEFINTYLKEFKGSDEEKQLKAKWFDDNSWLDNVKDDQQ